VTDGPLPDDLVRAATVLHALGDTAWFVGIGALIAVMAVCSAAWWRAGGARRRVAWLGVVAAACGLAQFGWFADHVFGVFAAPATLLQAAWFAAAATAGAGATTTDQPPVTAVAAPAVDHPPSGG